MTKLDEFGIDEGPTAQALQEILSLRVDIETPRVWVTESVTGDVVADVVRSLLYLDTFDQEAIEMWISSPGGDASSTLGLIDVMASLRAPIQTVGFGQVCSSAALILAAGQTRLVHPLTQVMLHGPVWCYTTETYIPIHEMSNDLRGMGYARDRMVELLQDRTALKEEAASMLNDGEEHWFRGGEAIVAAGLADAIMVSES